MEIRILTTRAAAIGIMIAASGAVAGESPSGAQDSSAPAATYQDSWGPPAGEQVPPIAATDQHRERRDFASLSGEGGLLLLVNRSAVW